MAETISELRSMPDDELVAKHDKHSERTGVGTAHYLRGRDRQRATDAIVETSQEMANHTQQMRNLTLVIALLTVANVIATFA